MHRFSGISILAISVLGGPGLSAAVFRVDTVTGADGASCGSAAAPCATIQQAVNLSSSGDTILVSGGTYVDNESCNGEASVVCVFQKQLTILGGFSSGNWSLPDPAINTTIIDGQNVRRGILVKRGGPGALPATSLRLEGFTIRNGRAVGAPHGFGGGLKANFADIVLRDMVFQGNVAVGGTDGQGGGGGVAVQANSDNIMHVTLERVLFQNNQATGGGGTNGGPALGGGLEIDHATLSALGLRFDGNTATGGAGSGGAGRDGLGGGAALTFGTTGTLRDLTATGNRAFGGSASATGGSAFGGAVFLEGGETPAADQTDVAILDSSFSGNAATGGNASTAGGGAGGAFAVFAARATLERSQVIGNGSADGTATSVPSSADGGGIFVEWPFTSTAPLNVVRNSVIAENSIDGSQGGGGGIRLLGARALVSHTTLVDNRILGAGFGSGILVGPRFASSKPSELTLAYSILADHTVPSGAQALYVQASSTVGSSADLTDLSLFVGNSHDTNSGLANSGTFTGFPGSNIFDPNPSTFFVNPAASDYHVDGTQPPTDSATGSTEALDLDGAARSGTRDLGADEFGALAFALSVGKLGVGSGTVTSSPAGINCGTDCYESYADGASVNLTATPDTGFFFTGWSGDADCTDGTVLMTQDRACTAQFEDQPPPCTASQDDLVLTGKTVNNMVTEEACRSITAGPSYTVGAAGNVTFHAPTIVLRSGFTVAGTFTAISGIP